MREGIARLASFARDWTIGLSDLARAILPGRRPARPGHGGECAAIPVVVLPGILENPRYLSPFTTWLAAAGHPVTTVASLGWNVSGLATSVDRVFDEVGGMGLRDAVLVAHSKGGLIGKAMLRDPRSQGMLIGMVAVATPFSGSVLWERAQATAAVRRSPLGLFHPASAELAGLAVDGSVNARIVSLQPSFDQVVPKGSHLEGAVNEMLPVGGHFRSVRDPASWAVIHAHVDRLGATRS
ncbi:esterase/lipase family protein [Tessaracoccus aquimaris]|uniref:esterase/lipase family protein n=1 Tax=Tessaracoccus aquimaris TaxID=1332264 RepID=UPI0011AB399C|nr:alpha/beta hydrolase [Tessaracoccus aquimaris]